MSLSNEIETLKAQQFIPAVQFYAHEDKERCGVNAKCCTSALITFTKNVLSASGCCNDPLEAVLGFIQSSFRWGIKRVDHLCDLTNKAHEGIDCAARSAAGLLALKIFFRAVHADHYSHPVDSTIPFRYKSIQLAVVVIIAKIDSGQAKMWRKSIANLYDRLEGPVVGRWIEDHCIYHQVLGMFDEHSGRLAVWEYGDWLTYTCCCEGALRDANASDSVETSSTFCNSIVGIKVTPYDMTAPDSSLLLLHQTPPGHCDNRVNAAVAASPTPARKKARISSVTKTLAAISTVDCPSSLKPTARREVFWDGLVRLPFGEWVTWGSLSAVQTQEKGEEVPQTVPVTVTPAAFTESRIHACKSNFQDVCQGPLRVFISGCHMSGNPMPGVGVAKCLRERWGHGSDCGSGNQLLNGPAIRAATIPSLAYDTSASGMDKLLPGTYNPSRLHITAVDDAVVDAYSGLTDSVFDACRSFTAYGKLRTRAKPLKPPNYLPLLETDRWSYADPNTDTDVDTGITETETDIAVDSTSSKAKPSGISCKNQFSSVSALEDHMLWETVVDMINSSSDRNSNAKEDALTAVEDQGLTFFIPCTDKDIDYFVARKEWVNKLCSATATATCADHDSSRKDSSHLTPFNDPSNPDAVTLKARYLKACESILCPSQEAVDSATKPGIEGPLRMGCFSIPEYFLVSPPKRSSSCSSDIDNTCSTSSDSHDRKEKNEVVSVMDVDVNSSDCASDVHVQSYALVLADAQDFCDRVGYPVVVKGVIGGHAVCHGWNAVAVAISSYPKDTQTRDHHCFIQKIITGTEKTIMFAAVDGELTGCLQLTKLINTIDGKVWSGELSAVPPRIVLKLRDFVAHYNWTGGGELEFIETLDEGLKQPVDADSISDSDSDSEMLPNWYMIDFNPRYPAWVYACCQAISQQSDSDSMDMVRCNLPADFVAHAALKRGTKNGAAPKPWAGFTAYENFKTVVFTRTVCEVGVSNYAICRKAAAPNGSRATVKGMASAHDDREDRHQQSSSGGRNDAAKEEMESRRRRGSSIDEVQAMQYCDKSHKKQGEKESQVHAQLATDVTAVCAAASAAVATKGERLSTPQYVLALSSVHASLKRHKQFVLDALALAHGGANTTGQILVTQMCLSVKTQPHESVLVAANKEGYLAECITMAEVRAALAAGFTPANIILTGPGKFWECCHIAEPQPLRLGSIFADSIADLRTILRRIKDPNDGLTADLVGVRLRIGTEASRFGIDADSPAILAAVGELIRRHLDPAVRIGVHMHFAVSAPNMGMRKWFEMARAVASMIPGFAVLCGRSHVDTIDFGGGWPAHMSDSDGVLQRLARLIDACRAPAVTSTTTTAANTNNGASPAPFTTTIQFELGKCITERSGGLICTLLETRELAFDTPKQTTGTYADMVSEAFLSLDYDDGDVDTSGTNYTDHVRVKRRALVVDACVGDISSPHIHPLYWRRAADTHSHDTSIEGSEWTALEPGSDEIWGRTCMEFDVLMGSSGGWGSATGGMCGTGRTAIALPNNMRAGDQLLITCCGAYDMTMQYDFGDGIGRSSIFPHHQQQV